MRDFELELEQSLKELNKNTELLEKKSKEIDYFLSRIENKATARYCYDDAYAFNESDVIDEIKQLIRKYNNTKFIEIGYDIQHDSWFMTAMTTDGERVMFGGFPNKNYALIDLKHRNFKQIDEAIEKIISIGTITIGLDNYVEPCYDMYKAIEILIKERDRILHNENPARKVSASKLPMACK